MKHDASRVLQALYAMGAPSQQTDMVRVASFTFVGG